MLQKFKDSLVKKTMYQVDSLYKILKMDMDDMDVACSKYHSFETMEEAKQYCIDCLKKEIDTLENRIDMYQNNIKSCKADLKKKNTLLKKYDIKEN